MPIALFSAGAYTTGPRTTTMFRTTFASPRLTSVATAAACITLLGSATAQAIVGGLPVRDPDLQRSVIQVGSCSGVVIARDLGLTAAHCAWGVPLPELSQGTGRRVDAVSFAPRFVVARQTAGYRAGDDRDDLALVRFATVKRRRPVIRPLASLPATGTAPGHSVEVLGYGKTGDAKLDLGTLRSVRLTIIDDEACTRIWDLRAAIQSRSWEPKSMICAGDPRHRAERSRDTCNGDSGGPLLVHTKRGWRVGGITSWGGARCGHGTPTVFADVTAVSEWLLDDARRWAPESVPGPTQISGIPAVGQTLSCNPPAWSSTPSRLQYEWSVNRRDGRVITDVPLYVVASADRGRVVACRALAFNEGGLGVSPMSTRLRVVP